MNVDPTFERVRKMLDSEIARMVAGQERRTHGHDRAELDESVGIVRYYQSGTLLWGAHAEMLASLYEGDIDLVTAGMLRWVWDERSVLLGRRRIDAAFREAKHYKLDVLIRTVADVEQEQALQIVRVAAQLARADGIFVKTGTTDKTYFALFDAREGQRHGGVSLIPAPPPSSRPAARVSIPSLGDRASILPPPQTSSEATSPLRSIPAPGLAPDAQTKAPSLEHVRPLGQAALAAVIAAQPSFREAVVIVGLELSGSKGRFSVQLVATSSAGRIEVVDAARPVVDAVAKMVADARERGELGWRTLIARIQPKATGSGHHLSLEIR